MEDTSSAGSAGENQSPELQQIQLRDNRQAAKGSRSQESTSRKRNRVRLYMSIGVPALTIVVIGVYVLVWFVNNSNPAFQPTSANKVVVQQVIGVKESTWQSIGTGGVSNPWIDIRGQPALYGPNGHPELFYVGYLWCQFCATESWALLNALSRFGTFSHLSQFRSYEDTIATFSFYQSTFTSQYVDFVPVEQEGNVHNIFGQYVTVQPFQGNQEQLFNTYDSSKYLPYSQSLPFIDLNNQYLLQYAFQPTILQNGSHLSLSWEEIASSLNTTSSSIAKNILGTANYLTAAICTVTQQQPGSVCTVPLIQQIEESLGKTSSTKLTNPVAYQSGGSGWPVLSERAARSSHAEWYTGGPRGHKHNT